ncbi:hypothetical protein C8R47DRAFT_1212308 [Mycena vitilis]|nr:hypothetical protein C8R47DRAFT_1212308 [Mycena vitilis]
MAETEPEAQRFWKETKYLPQAKTCYTKGAWPPRPPTNGLDPFQFLEANPGLVDTLRSQWRDGEALWGGQSAYEDDVVQILGAEAYSCEGFPLARNIAPVITVFPEYKALWEQLTTLSTEGRGYDSFHIHGGPGIGKSCCLLYILLRAVKENRQIMTLDDHSLTLFSGGKIWHHALTSQPQCETEFWAHQGIADENVWGPKLQHKVWVLVDGKSGTTPDPFVTNTLDFFVIYASSPDANRTAWLRPRDTAVYTMQPPRWKELVTVFRYFTLRTEYLSFDRQNEAEVIAKFKDLRSNFVKYGPQARVLANLLWKNESPDRDIEEGFQKLKQKTQLGGAAPTTPSSGPHTIFRIVRLGDGYPHDSTQEIQSPYLRNKMLEETKGYVVKQLIDNFWDHSPPGFIGPLWQSVALKVISGDYKYGGELKLRETSSRPTTSQNKVVGALGREYPAQSFRNVTKKEWNDAKIAIEDARAQTQASKAGRGRAAVTEKPNESRKRTLAVAAEHAGQIEEPSAKRPRTDCPESSSMATEDLEPSGPPPIPDLPLGKFVQFTRNEDLPAEGVLTCPRDAFFPMIDGYTKWGDRPVYFQTSTASNHKAAVVAAIKRLGLLTNSHLLSEAVNKWISQGRTSASSSKDGPRPPPLEPKAILILVGAASKENKPPLTLSVPEEDWELFNASFDVFYLEIDIAMLQYDGAVANLASPS